MTIMNLIQQTQRRRGLPLITAMDEQNSIHPEMSFEISVWEECLRGVPDEWLDRAWGKAGEGRNWHQPFLPDDIAHSYKVLLMDEKDRLESLRRTSDEIKCEHCRDLGYQPIWQWRVKPDRWYLAQRPCSCETTPATQRSESPLQSPEFVKGGRTGNWVRLADLLQHGAPESAPADDYVIM